MPKIKKGNMPVPQTWAGQDKRFGETLKNNVDVLAGFNGDPLDKAVTMRALLDSGIVSLASGYGAYSGASSSIAPRVDIPNLDVPPAPYNLAANGAFQNILLSWSLAGFRGLAYQEVFRHTSDIIADATLLGVVSATRGFYTDSVGESSSYYYWVRAVNQNGVAGPFNSSTGTLGETAPDVQLLLNTLNGAITASELATDLTTTLDGFATEISDLETTYGTTASAAASAAAAAASESAAIAAEASALGANTTAIAAKVAALLAQTNAETAEDNAETAETNAETAQSAAETAQTAASTSATGAAGSAASASTSQTAAANSATAAGSSATAAATSESNASTYATTAGTGATASETAQLAAETAKGLAEVAQASSAASAESAAGSASTAESSSTTAAEASDAAGVSAGAAATSAESASGYVTEAEAASTASSESQVAAEAARDLASGSATASAESAATASAAQTASSESAAAANVSKLAAETAEADALAYKNTAVQSASDAAGSSSTASEQAGLASGSADASGVSAGASSDSAGVASTKADESSASADASEVSRLAAEAGQEGAEDAAAAAVLSAASATASSGAAGDFAATSEAKSVIATTKAAQALTYSENAAESATAADGSATSSATSLQGIATYAQSVNLSQPFSLWSLGSNQTLQTVTDGKVGSEVLRLVGGGFPDQGNYIAVDPTKTYEVKFWARPSSNCTGKLYFTLRQYINDTGTTGPVNSGRSPYKPSAKTRAQHNTQFGTTNDWGEYVATWESGDWQSGVKYFKPTFLDNHGSGVAGHWDIQALTIREVTDLAATKAEVAVQAESINGLEAQYTVKIDANGAVAGFGLASTTTSSGNNTSEFYVNADRFAIMGGGSSTTTITPFVVQAAATTIDGIAVPAGVYMDGAFIKNGSITTAQIGTANIDTANITGTLSADRISGGTISTSLLDLDGVSIRSNSAGELELGTVSATKITTGTLDATNVTITNLTASKIDGDISDLFPFEMQSALFIDTPNQSEQTLYVGQIPAQPSGIEKRPYISAEGWGVFENDDVYRIELWMRQNVPLGAGGTSTLGTIVLSGAYYTARFFDVAGDQSDNVSTGEPLYIGGVQRGTATSVFYYTSSGNTRVYYTLANGAPVTGMFVSGDVVTTNSQASNTYRMVNSFFFRSPTDYHPYQFSISGGLGTKTEYSIDFEIRIGVYDAYKYYTPYNQPTKNWTNDKIYALQGIAMSLR